MLREFPSRVQKYRCDFPQVTMILVSVGWKSAANTASFEHFKKRTQRIKCHRPRAGYWASQAPLTSLGSYFSCGLFPPLSLALWLGVPGSAGKTEQGDVTLGGDTDVPLPSLSPVTGSLGRTQDSAQPMAALSWLTVAAVIPQEFLSLGSLEVTLQQPHQHLSTHSYFQDRHPGPLCLVLTIASM